MRLGRIYLIGESSSSTILLLISSNVNGQADPDHVTCSGDTPAILAAREGHLCAMVELERGGADLDKANAAGETPLIVASYSGRVEVVAYLASIMQIDLDR